MWTWYSLDFFVENIVYAYEGYRVPFSIQPTKSTNGRKVRRGINRLLPLGHRYRGDVGL